MGVDIRFFIEVKMQEEWPSCILTFQSFPLSVRNLTIRKWTIPFIAPATDNLPGFWSPLRHRSVKAETMQRLV